MDEKSIIIYYVNGQFLIFNKQDAINLRLQRITWQVVGSTQLRATLPCLISHYGAKICLDHKLAQFYRLNLRIESLQSSRDAWLIELERIKSKTKTDFIEYRKQELLKRGIDATQERIGTFDETNLRIPVRLEPRNETSICEPIRMSKAEIQQSICVDDYKMTIYKDLFGRGFYITSGFKFGGDFIAYQGDPLMYHGTFVVRALPGIDGLVDLDRVNYMELNTILRICDSSNKIPLFGVVSDNADDSEVSYYTLRSKEYIEVSRATNNFQSIDPESNKRYIFNNDGVSDLNHRSKKMKVDF